MADLVLRGKRPMDRFIEREATAWRGLALFEQMLGNIGGAASVLQNPAYAIYLASPGAYHSRPALPRCQPERADAIHVPSKVRLILRVPDQTLRSAYIPRLTSR